MDNFTQFIIRNTVEGKIDKRIGAEILRMFLENSRKPEQRDIAITGIAVKMPMAEDVDSFWNNLKNGVDCTTDIPSSRRDDLEELLRINFDLQPGRIKYRKASYLESIDKFDYSFFNISPLEAKVMDPNQRLFLQTAYQAVEDAGYGGGKLSGTNTGVFVGYSNWSVYGSYIMKTDPSLTGVSIPGNMSAIIAGRLSYLLDLKGPSMLVDTACSSSLVAIYLACKSIRSGDCDQALAGGIRINFLPVDGVYELGIESGCGQTRAFDRNADGTNLGEGVAAVILKPLHKAIEDGDPIYAVIKGVASNQDGTSVGITAPNSLAQKEVIIKAWKDAQIDPETISYIEAHGTGTKLGDPIEITAIQKAFMEYTNKKQFCAIGSLKTNIGHLDNAAGAASLIKAALALKHKVIPPTLHFNQTNRAISFEQSPVYVSDRAIPWKTDGFPRRCGVSSFGFSGTNCHMVLEEAPPAENNDIADVDDVKVLTLSAKSKEALNMLLKAYIEFFNNNIDINDSRIGNICFTANTGRGHYSYRLAFVFKRIEELKEKLAAVPDLGSGAISQNGIYLGYHKIVPGNKDFKESGEISETEVRELGRTGDAKIKQFKCMQAKERSLLEDICSLYVKGADVDWEQLYMSGTNKRVNIPAYRFERNRCWIEPAKTPSTSQVQEKTISNSPSGEYPLESGSARPKVELKGRSSTDYTEIECRIAQIWGDVLGYPDINIYDSFHHLGGDSILMTKISARIHKEIKVEIPLKDLFANPTVKELAEYINKAARSIYSSIQRVEQKETYVMSAAQKRLYILNQLQPESTAYNLPRTIIIEGKIDRYKFEQSFRKLVERHETLRTSFEMIDGKPVQRIHPEVYFKVEYFEDEENECAQRVKEFIRPFDLSKAPLLRAALIKVKEDRYAVLYDMHHIISDGTSMNIIAKEFMDIYQAKELPGLKLQYKDYTCWQNKLYENDTLISQQEYWMNVFKGEIPVLNLPFDYDRPLEADYEGGSFTLEINQVLHEKIKQLSLQNGATLFMTLLAAYNTLLMKMTGQEDIVIGTPVAGRNHGDLENMVGIFLNTLALRNFPNKDKTFKDFLNQVKQNALKAFENQDYQFEMLLDKLKVNRDLKQTPLFNVMFNMLNMSEPQSHNQVNGLKFFINEFDNNTSIFDISLYIEEVGSGLRINSQYRSKLFKKSTIEYIMGEYLKLLEEITNHPEKKLKHFKIFDREQLKFEYNMVQPLEKFCKFTMDEINHPIPFRFEQQAAKFGDSLAIKTQTKAISYRSLNHEANRAAHGILECIPELNQNIALLFEHDVDMVIGMLAVLKSGNAYVPLDPSYPGERLSYYIEDSGTGVILTNTANLALAEKLSDWAKRPIQIININMLQAGLPDCNPCVQISPGQRAYILYTSGSTGKPKGVVQSHTNVLHFIRNYTNNLHINPDDKLTLFSSYSFDAAVMDIYGALLNGAALYPYSIKSERGIQGLAAWMRDEGITIYHSIPTVYRYFMDSLKQDEKFPHVRLVVMGGEAVFKKDVQSYKKYFSDDCIFVNGLGPTESTVTLQYFIGKDTEIPRNTVSVGYPVDHTEVYILDENGEEAPVFATGELVYKSAHLALGYWNLPDKTQEVFTTDPVTREGRVYRSGDLGRRLPDGSITFIGRSDYQVKIRGYRIELHEIEVVLESMPAIQKGAVTAFKNARDEYFLAAYYSLKKGMTIDAHSVRAFLKERLPDYMLPSHYVVLENMPVTPNGKIDRSALQKPDSISTAAKASTLPACEQYRNETEEKLIEIWKEVLEVNQVEAEDNFFMLGGHSLKAMTLCARIHRAFGTEVPLKEVFMSPTVRDLAVYINKSGESIYSSIQPAEQKEYYPLCAAQRRMFIANRLEGSNTSYNIPGALAVEGRLDKQRLEKAFDKLVQRHDALRTSFEIMDEQPVQRIHEETDFQIEYFKAEQNEVENIIKGFIKPFDLSTAPLLRVGLIELSDQRYILVFDMHHIISDGASKDILAKDFVRLYTGEELSALRIQYKDFVCFQNGLDASDRMQAQKEYWLKVFENGIPELNLPLDYPRVHLKGYEGDSEFLEINNILTGKLDKFASGTGTTLYMVLLAAYNVLLSKITGQHDIVVGSIVSGRSHEDLENIVGVFINILAVRSFPKDYLSFNEFLYAVRDTTLNGLKNQDYPFDSLVQVLGLKANETRNVLFDTLFVCQRVDSDGIQTGGLKLSNYQIHKETAKYDILFEANILNGKIILKVEYRTGLYKKETIKQLLEQYLRILGTVVENPYIHLKDIEILDQSSKTHYVSEITKARKALDIDFDF